MDDKRQIVLEAAKPLFLKYGFTKVNMGDIAKGSGMSRPLLYTMFNGKEDIFECVVIKLAEEITHKLKQELLEIEDPLEKLDKVFDRWVLQIQEELMESEEAKELYESTFSFVQKTMDDISSMFIKDIEAVLKLLPQENVYGELSSHELAKLYAYAISGFKKNCRTINEIREQIVLMVQATIRIPKS